MEVLSERRARLLGGGRSSCFALVLLAWGRGCCAAAFTGGGLIGLIRDGDWIAFAFRARRAHGRAGVGLGRVGIRRVGDAKAQNK